MSGYSRGIGALVILSIAAASTGVISRYLILYFTVFQQLYLRCAVAFILVYIVFHKSIDLGKLKKISHKEWTLIIFRSTANLALGAVLWVKGATIAKLANVGFIDALPITAAISFLFSLEKFSYRKIFLLILSMVGVIIITVKDFSNLTSLGIGELLVLISGFFFAIRNISRRWHTKLLNDQEISLFMFFFGGLMLLFLSLLSRENINPMVFQLFPAGLIVLGGLLMGINILLTNFGFNLVPAAVASNVVNLEIIFTIVFGFFFYGEVSNLKELLGGALIIISVVWLSRMK